MAILAAAGTAAGAVKTVTGFVGGLLGSDDKDPARKAQADQLGAAFLAGNDAALVQLRCLSGDPSVRDEAIRLGFLTADEIRRGTPCGYATKEAQAYARGVVTRVMTQRGAQEVAVDVTQQVVRPALNAAGYEIIPKPDLGSLLLIGAVLVGGWLLLKGR